jgi:membrane associated rhomboid family serine protease
MPTCPNCATPLNTIRQREGLFYRCPTCEGRAITMPQIRRVAGDRFVTSLLRQINANSFFGNRPCPFCGQRMRQFNSADPPLELDACKPCGAVWFDPQEFETVPEGAVESPNELNQRAAEAFARYRIEQMKERGVTDSEPDADWKAIPAFFGFPVEAGAEALSCRPWLTWGLSVIIAIVSISAFFNLKSVVETYGFVPAEPWRLGGLTWITSFFLHGGILHLVGNLYFLLIFGDNVEDFLGRTRYALLILAATLAGDIVHWLVAFNSTTPSIGASGGISGIIVFYALKLPQARLGFLFRYYWRFQWVQMPAWVALVLWLLMQTFGVFMQLSGFSNVAATAHLGGAAVGFALWMTWKKREPEADSG